VNRAIRAAFDPGKAIEEMKSKSLGMKDEEGRQNRLEKNY
jgi:hypothetical protein